MNRLVSVSGLVIGGVVGITVVHVGFRFLESIGLPKEFSIFVAVAVLGCLLYFLISAAVAKGVAEGIRKSDIGTTIRSAILQAGTISKDEDDDE